MVYDSVYEANNYLRGTARKQHFWDYFSGSKLQDAPSLSFTDNFSSSTGWTSVINTNSGVVGGKLIGLMNSSGSNGDGVWKDYGLIFDDNKFVLRCKFQIVTQSGQAGNASSLYFGLSDTNGATSPNGNRDGFAIVVTNYAVSGMLWNYPDGTTWDNADTDLSLAPTQTTYYLEFKRTSATSVTFTLYSDSGFSTVVRTHTQSISSSLNGLRYLMMQGWRNGSSNTTKVEVSNLQLYNGVSSIDDAGIRWTTNNVTGTGTFEMADDVDGGFKIITSTSSPSYQSITFNDIRQYDPTASEVIMVLKKLLVAGNFTSGLSNGSTSYPSHSVVVTNYSNDTYYSLSSTASTGVSRSVSTTPVDTAWHTHKLTNSSADLKLNIDGVLGVTRTDHRPIIEMQPFVYSNSTALASEIRVRYFEAYNT